METPQTQQPLDNVRPILSVSQITTAIKKTVETNFSQLRVRAELGRVSQPQSGHIYLDFKDEHAVLAAVIWRPTAAQLNFSLETGLEVIASGRLTIYGPQSRYQFIVEHIEPAGQGALIALLEQRRKQLAAEGLFDAERKRPLPMLPEVIGLITSPTAAVLRDILHRVQDRFPRRILLWPVRVQGTQCPSDVTAAIDGFNALDGKTLPRPDILIVARGGGSLEDLWGFNDEAVVRAAAASRIPIISALGHETDTTLLDYAADYRAPTPTAAAERAVPVRANLQAHIASCTQRYQQAMRRRFAYVATQLEGSARGLKRPSDILNLREQQYDDQAARLRIALQRQWAQAEAAYDRLKAMWQIGRFRQQYSHYEQALRSSWARLLPAWRSYWQAGYAQLSKAQTALDLLSHEGVLARGFALVFAPHRLVRKRADAPRATPLRIQLAGKQNLYAQTTAGPARRARLAHPSRIRHTKIKDLFGDDA